MEADAHVVGVSTLAAGHRTLVPALYDALCRLYNGHDSMPLIVCGGVIPEQDYKELEERAGVAAFFGPGTSVAEAAKRVIELIDSKR